MLSASIAVAEPNLRWCSDGFEVTCDNGEVTNALTIDPDASAIDEIRPTTISEKYSADPKLKATAVRGFAKTAIRIVATVPAISLCSSPPGKDGATWR